ncbi:MAG: response regulator, partial [Desulfocapsaceae bacterium]|nr:response regulator [Desulfocapsaceae bacterium]
MKPIRILLVDDEVVILAVLARELRLKNYEVSVADGGEEALAMIRSSRFDAVITDLDMPDIDGISVLKVTKQCSPQTC